MTFIYSQSNRYEPKVDMARCRASVAYGGRSVGIHQCRRKATVTREGVGFCSLHDPEAVKAKREKQEKQWAKERKVSTLQNQMRSQEHEIADMCKTYVDVLTEPVAVEVRKLMALEAKLEAIRKGEGE